jgi:hypothetical protein
MIQNVLKVRFRGQEKFYPRWHRRGLIEVVQIGNGRGMATEYRIRIEDPRFPPPKERTLEGVLNGDKCEL